MNKRVLLADDDPDLQFLTQMVLSEAGFDVVTVSNGLEAVSEARLSCFDVILMDAEMPVMNGYDAYRELLSDPATSRIPVVFLTARMPGEKVNYILKPFDAEELPGKLLEIIDNRK